MNFKPLIVFPLYNHGSLIRKAVLDCLKYYDDILIVDDGSSDGGADTIKDLPVTLISFKKNRGKGAAILVAADYAKAHSFTHIVSIDSDGQHYPKDISKLLAEAAQYLRAIIIGKRDFDEANVPALSRFGRKFSGFWAKVQTSNTIVDIQSGFRVYPLEIFGKYKIYSRHFDFEVEIIIKAIWAGFDVREVDVGVYYPPKENRISHFNLISGNAALGILNTYLTIRSMLPIPHKKYVYDGTGQPISLNPYKVVMGQIKNKNNPLNLGLSAAWSMFCGSLALPGLRNMILIVGVGWFNLNRLVAFSVDKLAIPPFIPFVCVEVGYFMRHGEFLTEISWRIIGREFGYRVLEWFLGSLIVAPIAAIVVGSVVFVAGHILRKGAMYGSKVDKQK
ncbi:MAG: glycosyltransferase family 2 protein [Elusimicrobiota bacterium]|nr:glycosyltransferase family 2 protein [Elusimicrobiota bacterium]